MSRTQVSVKDPADLDRAAVLALADGAPVLLDDDLLARVGTRRHEALAAIAAGAEVYGVTTGMGALSGTRLGDEERVGHSARLMAARAVGGPPWLEPREVRALIGVRLRTFLGGDAAVSPGLCAWLATLLERDLLPAVPSTGSGAAGEILPLAHAWAHLAGGGELLGDGGTAVPAAPLLGEPGPPVLGAKEGIALLAGVPLATALATLRAAELRRLVRQASVVAAAEIDVAGATRDPYAAAVARGDDVLADVLASVRAQLAPAGRSGHLQAPVSFRVIGPVLAQLTRATAGLEQAADRALAGVTDSPAFLDVDGAARFVGTAGFHGLDLAAALEAARGAAVHAAATGAARLHRLLDARLTGLPAQLSADPGPQAGLVPVHKRVVAAVHAAAAAVPAYALPMETSHGQEDVQTFALEAAESLRTAVDALELALAAAMLAVHQARTLDPTRVPSAPTREAWAQVAAALPAGADDRPWGRDLTALTGLLRDGWACPEVSR